MKPWYKSRKLWAAVVSFAVLVLDGVWLHAFDVTTKAALGAVVAGYLIGQGIADRPKVS